MFDVMSALSVSDLYRHQRAGLRHLVARGGVACLFHDAGVGKTTTTLRYLEALARKANRHVRVLVVAPLAAVATWPQETEKWLPADIDVDCAVLGGTIVQRADAIASAIPGATLARYNRIVTLGAGSLQILVVNIDTFSQRRGKGHADMATKLLNSVKRYNPDVLVVDELHTCRNYSNRQRLLARIAKHVPRRIGLTGTPMPKGIENVYRQLQIIDPEVFPTSYNGFLDTYAVMGGFQGREIVSYRRLDEFEEKLKDVAHVVKKEDALDLPPTTDVVVPVTLSAKELKAYQEIKKELLTELDSGEVITIDNALVKSLRLRQAALGFLPKPDGDGYAFLGTSKIAAAKSLIHETLEGEKRIVVFTTFGNELEALKQTLAATGTRIDVINGATPSDDRLAIRKRFASSDPQRIVLIAQVGTVNVGINELVSASNAVFTTLPLDRAVFDQAKARLDRQGQTKPVTYYYIEASGTVDGVVRAAHQTRADLESAITAHIKSN